MRSRIAALVAVLFFTALTLTASSASAGLHLTKVVQIFGGTPAAPNARYVQLQLYGAGQIFFNGATMRFFNGAGVEIGSGTFMSNLGDGANQATILVASMEAATFFGVTPDLTVPASLIDPAGGMVCFTTANYDCMAWGNYAGLTGSPFFVGTPDRAPPTLPLGIPAGKALSRRLDVAGSPTLLEDADDTNNSENDFVVSLPQPRNNAGQSGTVPSATCGNGTVQGLEQCDNGNTLSGDGCRGDCAGSEQCGDALVDAAAGEECEDQNSTSGDGCDANCQITGCGNGMQTAGEACDDGNVTGGDGCSASCELEVCGDGDTTGPEVCDDGNTLDGDGCRGDCLGIEVCGDDLLDVGEVCDDGNIVAGDGCRADCLGLELCGDGLTDVDEACDDDNAIDTDACLTSCDLASCGDGFIQSGVETCEPPGTATCSAVCQLACTTDPDCADSDVCTENEHCDSSTCESDAVPTDDQNVCTNDACDAQAGVMHVAVTDGQLCDVDSDPLTRDICLIGACAPSACGDGFEDAFAGEGCDDGNLLDADGCQATCLLPVCGDSVVDAGEACDDGNDEDGDGCTDACAEEVCGDGVLHDDEECDDGNGEDEDGCSAACVIELCGDGVRQDALGEQCDDGNDVDGDGCESNCTLPTCGNAIVDSPEQCDDGNEMAGDGCSSSCTLEDGEGGGGTGGSGPEGGAGGAGADDGDGAEDGCSCRSASSGESSWLGAALLILLAALRNRKPETVKPPRADADC